MLSYYFRVVMCNERGWFPVMLIQRNLNVFTLAPVIQTVVCVVEGLQLRLLQVLLRHFEENTNLDPMVAPVEKSADHKGIHIPLLGHMDVCTNLCANPSSAFGDITLDRRKL